LRFLLGCALTQTIFAQVNPIQLENLQTGTANWTLASPATNHEIEGYADLTSVNLGGTVNLFVSKTDIADSTFTIEVFRTGYYSGLGARLMQTISGLPLQQQGIPMQPDSDGATRCHWSSSYSLSIPTTWTSGVYLARLTADDSGYQSYIIFVVRDDSSRADVVFESSVTTFQAYNFWPGDSNAGHSLYHWAPAQETQRVSFDRPYALGFSYSSDQSPDAAFGVGAGEYLTNLQPGPDKGNYPISPFGFEYNMVPWLEMTGYDLTYITDIDHHENPALLTNHHLYLSVGHNEYWSMEMRTNLINALQAGVNAAFFSANTLYWQIRLEDGDRTIVCYKGAPGDQDAGTEYETIQWRYLTPTQLPEAAVVGVEYVGDPVANGPMIMDDSTSGHFLKVNTGFANPGQSVAGLVGYEADAGVPVSGFSPPGTAVLATTPIGPFIDFDNPPGFACDQSGGYCVSNMTWYTDPQYGYSVFATGSMYWSWGLDNFFSASNPQTPNPHPDYSSQGAIQLTANVLFNTMAYPDDFGFPRDPNRWNPAIVDQPTSPSPLVTVTQSGDGQLVIQPADSATGFNYNGYLSVPAVDLTNASFSVQVQAANVGSGVTDTSFVLYNDQPGVWYRIIEEGGWLYFQVNGSGPSIPYDPASMPTGDSATIQRTG